MVKFYKCEHCGNVALMMHDAGPTPVCCGSPMTELVPGTTDAAVEKHVPAVTRDGSRLSARIGEVLHPMLEEHYIEFILVEQDEKIQAARLKPGQEPKAEFTIDPNGGECVVYEFCNLHGLWKK